MLPVILVAVGAYLIGDSVLGDGKKYAKGGMMAKGGKIEYDYEIKVQPDFKYKNRANQWLEDVPKDSLKYKLAVLILRGKKNPDDILGIKNYNQYSALLRSLEDAKGESKHDWQLRTENYTLGQLEDWTTESLREMFYVSATQMSKGGKLVGKQKNLDVNKNGKLDAEDFKMLRGKKMAEGGLVVKSDEDLREIAKYMATMIKKKRWDFKDLVYYFEKDNNYDYNYRVKIWDDMNVYEMKKTEENVYKVLKAIVEANEAKK